MLDPLTALGVASNVIQLVDFTSKVSSKTKDLRFHGKTVENTRLEALTVDIVALSENLLASPLLTEASSRKSSDDEAVLLHLLITLQLTDCQPGYLLSRLRQTRSQQQKNLSNSCKSSS